MRDAGLLSFMAAWTPNRADFFIDMAAPAMLVDRVLAFFYPSMACIAVTDSHPQVYRMPEGYNTLEAFDPDIARRLCFGMTDCVNRDGQSDVK